MHKFIKELESQQIKSNVAQLHPGDTVEVKLLVFEGKRKRFQFFEGMIIAIKNRGLHSNFTIRKFSSGEGIDRVFQIHSPVLQNIIVKKLGIVHKAKLYYLRNLKGKSARIKSRIIS